MSKCEIHNIKTDCDKKNEENSLVKINPPPIIKDEDKSFFYKCACLYKTEEYKNENIFTKLFIIFTYGNIYILCFIIYIFVFIFYLPLIIYSFIFMFFCFICMFIFSTCNECLTIYEFYNNGLNEKDCIDWVNQDKYNLTEYINNKK